MSSHSGPANWWTKGTDSGRKHIAVNGIVQDGLILNLDAGVSESYPGSGTVWYDLSGNDNHFTLNGSLTHNIFTGFSGFTQTNRWYRNNFPSNLKTSQGGNGYTVCVWANCTQTENYQKLLGNGVEQNYIELHKSADNNAFSQLDGSTLYYNSGIEVSNNTLYLSDSTWRMFAATNLNRGSDQNPTDAFGIGSEGDGVNNYPWSGNIAIVLMYNRVLSTQEINRNYLVLLNRFTTVSNNYYVIGLEHDFTIVLENGDDLLLEDGSYILENGEYLLQENGMPLLI